MALMLSYLTLLLSVVLGVLGVVYEYRNSETGRLKPMGFVAVCIIICAGAASLGLAALNNKSSIERANAQATELAVAREQRSRVSEELLRLRQSSDASSARAEAQLSGLQAELSDAKERATSLELSLLEAQRQNNRLLSRSAKIDVQLGIFFQTDAFKQAMSIENLSPSLEALNPWFQELLGIANRVSNDQSQGVIESACDEANADARLCIRGNGFYTGQFSEVLFDWEAGILKEWRARYPGGTPVPPDAEIYLIDDHSKELIFRELRGEQPWDQTVVGLGLNPGCRSLERIDGVTKLFDFRYFADEPGNGAWDHTLNQLEFAIDERTTMPLGFRLSGRLHNLIAIENLADKTLLVIAANNFSPYPIDDLRKVDLRNTYGDPDMPLVTGLNLHISEGDPSVSDRFLTVNFRLGIVGTKVFPNNPGWQYEFAFKNQCSLFFVSPVSDWLFE